MTSVGPALRPPQDEAQAWMLAQRLEAMDGPQRRRLLARATAPNSGDSHNPWLDFLAALMAPEEAGSAEQPGPLASQAVLAAETLGYGRDPAKTLVGRFCALPSVQQAWRHWTRVGDRNELRLRLEVLGQCNTIDPELVPFVTFFFRASDHALYHAAAITIGRHILSCNPLWEYVEGFAASRGLSLGQPLALNGARSRRRLLLVMAAALARSQGSPEATQQRRLPDLPFVPPHQPGADGLREVAETPADLNAWLQALHLLWESPQTRDRVAPLAELTITSLCDLPDHLVDRRVLRDYGILLVSYYAVRIGEGVPAQEAAQRWWAVVSRELDIIKALAPPEFGRRVAALLRLEETLRTLSFLDEASAAAGAARLQAHPPGDDRFYLLLRVLTWARRRYPRELPSWAAGIAALLEQATSGVLSPWLQAAWEAQRRAEGHEEATLTRSVHRGHPELLDRLLSALGSEGQWLSLDPPARALVLLLLLDETQYVGYPEQQLRAFLLRHQSLPASAADQPALSRSTGVAAVVLRVLTWEQDGAEAYLDSRLLHQIQDTRALLALLPSHRDSAMLSILADAFEHQLRWRLQWDPGFDPFLFLYQTTVRDPHPMFLVHLEQVIQDRAYLRPNLEEVPVHQWTSMLSREMFQVTGDPLSPDLEAPEVSPGFATAGPDFPRGTRSAGLLNRVRRRLTALEEERTGLRWRVRALAEAVGEAGADSAQPGSTLLDLLRALNQSQQPVLQSGYPAWSTMTLPEIERRLQEIVAAGEVHAAALMPESWDSVETVGEAIISLKGSLQEIRGLLLPALPLAEEMRFRRVVEQLETDLDDWLRAVGRVQRAWSEYAAGPSSVDQAAWDGLLAAVSEAWAPPERMDVIQRVWAALRRHVENAAGLLDPWAADQRLLDWSLETPQFSRWNQEEQRQWLAQCHNLIRSMLRQAMDARWEGRVVQLLTESRYRPLRRHADLVPDLEEARPWCLDRYRGLTAVQVHKDVAAVLGQRSPSIIGGMVAFFFHFSPVWIGLLVGGFLVLDFGDAWTDMAEVGDIRGIVATFMLGLAGSFLYLLTDLRRKSRASPDELSLHRWGFYLVRVVGFVAICLVYTVASTSTLWWLLSGTDAVVHGPQAIGQIAAWSGFTLLFGTFFGLIAKEL